MALRIPSGLAADAHLCDGAEVEVAVEGGRLVVASVAAPELSLAALLAGVTAENVHAEQPGDGARGAEAW